jgi:hypothetical protein
VVDKVASGSRHGWDLALERIDSKTTLIAVELSLQKAFYRSQEMTKRTKA